MKQTAITVRTRSGTIRETGNTTFILYFFAALRPTAGYHQARHRVYARRIKIRKYPSYFTSRYLGRRAIWPFAIAPPQAG